jgi:hypothetical protein
MLALAIALLLLVNLLLLLQIWLYSLEAPQIRQPEHPFPEPGIHFCSHRAKRWIPFQHMYFKISPRDSRWAQSHPKVFSRRDSSGKAWCTLGAGPRKGRLWLAFNRNFDVADPVSFQEAVLLPSIEEENRVITALLNAAGSYTNNLAFSVLPSIARGGYNCNSMIAALAASAGIGLPRFAGVFLHCLGTGRKVPLGGGPSL